MPTSYEKTLTDLFALADVEINGHRLWDIQVHDPRFYKRVLSQSSLGLGESYMDGWWDCEQIEEFFSGYFEQISKRKSTVQKTDGLSGMWSERNS